MPLVEACRRTKNYTHAFPDVTLRFKPNEFGHVVCDVASQDAVERLLQTPTGFRLYGVQAEPDEPLSAALTKTEPVAVAMPAAPALLDAPTAQAAPLEPAATAAEPVESSPYLLMNGDTIFDLRPLDDAALFEFCKLNGIPVHPNSKGNTIRDKIVAFLKAPE